MPEGKIGPIVGLGAHKSGCKNTAERINSNYYKLTIAINKPQRLSHSTYKCPLWMQGYPLPNFKSCP